MKKIQYFVFTVFLCFLLSSCTQNNNAGTFFIHAAAFEKNSDGYNLYTVCESTKEKDNSYFVISEKADSIESATKQLMSKNKECYFATANLFIIDSEVDKETIQSLAKELCDSNIYPTKSKVICIENCNLADFTKKIKSNKDLEKIKKEIEKKSNNAVRFFAAVSSGKKVKLPSFTVHKNEIKKLNDKVFSYKED